MFVRIKRVAPRGLAAYEDENYAPLVTDSVADVGFLTVLACATNAWGAPTKARLYLAAAGGDDEPDAAAELAALSGEPLHVGWPLARAGVAPGAWLLARVPPPGGGGGGAIHLLRVALPGAPAFRHEVFAPLVLAGAATAGAVAERACAHFSHWGVAAGQIALVALPDEAAARAAQRYPAAAAAAARRAALFASDGVAPGAWLLALVPVLGSSGGGVSSFEADVALLEDALHRTLTPAQRDAFRSDNFDGVRAALREGRFASDRAQSALLLAQLDGLVRTTTQRRLSSAENGLCLDGLLVSGGARGRAADIFCAVRVADGAMGAAKVFYAAPPGSDAGDGGSAADGEYAVSRLVDAAAAAPAGAWRARVVRYSDRFVLGRGRSALFMPLYARSLHALVHASHAAAPLPAAFLLRAAVDVLRGLALLHGAGWAHCDVKADNVMFDGAGAATLIDLGAATRLGERTREGAPEALALGRDVAVASAAVDLACLAATLWWAARREAGVRAGATAEALAERADEAGGDVARAVAAILRAASAAEALAAVAPSGA